MRLKVLYLLNHAGKAGTERYVQTLIQGLGKEQIDPYFAYNEEGPLVADLEAMGVPVYRIEMRSRFDRKAAKALAALCKTLQINLIHTHYLRENYIAMLSKAYQPDVKVVYTSHFIMKNDGITRLSNRLLSPRQDGVIAVCSKGQEQLIRNGYDGEKIQVIFNAVDPAFWRAPMQSTLREEFHIPEDTFVMLCASRFAHDKGHSYLIDSVDRLRRLTDRPFQLVLAGDGERLDAIRAQVQNLQLDDRILFIGFRKDMKNLLWGSDLYVNSSEHEALSFLLIEAIAAGRPVVATNMGGNSDIVNEKNDCGILVEYNQPDDMAAAMRAIIEDPALARRYQQGALRTVEQVFHVEGMLWQTHRMYQSACKRREKQ